MGIGEKMLSERPGPSFRAHVALNSTCYFSTMRTRKANNDNDDDNNNNDDDNNKLASF